jgi:broad specificity phosphatase PhoE
MRIWLVRHGESEGNADHSVYFTKHDADIQLTAKGTGHASLAAKKIIQLLDRFDNQVEYPTHTPQMFNMFTSTFRRAKQTASVIKYELSGIPMYSFGKHFTMPILREREWGKLRELTFNKLHTEHDFNFYNRPDGGESFADCYQRAMIFHQHLLNNASSNNIVVSHGEFNKVYLMYLFGWTVEEFESYKSPKNGEVFLIENNQLSSATPLTKK